MSAITISLILVVRILLKNDEKTGVIISLFYIVFFSYQSILSLIRRLDNGTDLDIVVSSVLIIILGVAIYFIVKSQRSYYTFTGFLRVYSISLISFVLLNITSYAFRDSNENQKLIEVDQSPNIIHIILDAYGREDVLKDYYSYDNSAFIGFLKDKGFYVASESVANYSRTYLSLGSIFKMDYVNDIIPDLDPKSGEINLWEHPIENFDYFRLLKKQGYSTYAISSGYLPTEYFNADIYKNQGYTNNFDELLFNSTLLSPFIARLDKSWDRYSFRRNKILDAIALLKNLPDFNTPTYVFAHIPSPHPPVIFDKHGNPIPDHEKDLSKEGYYEEYGDQISYLNGEVKETIASIIDNASRPTVILLHGDHGLRSHEYWYDENHRSNFRESLAILNAYYFYDGNYEKLYDNITPVNSFRLIFNQFMNTEFQLLEDKSYLSVWLEQYDLIEYVYKSSTVSLADSVGRFALSDTSYFLLDNQE